MTWISDLNRASESEATAALMRVCGSTSWARSMAAIRPFLSAEHVFQAADEVWNTATRSDVIEALSHHPLLGQDMTALRAKFATTADWSADEQSGVRAASESDLNALAALNRAYLHRFGFTPVVCATGKSVTEMTALLQARFDNPPEIEWKIAAEEQRKITRIRLEKL